MVMVALSACRPVTVQHAEGVVPVSFRVDDAAYWLEEWHWITGLPEGQQREILADREREFEQSATSRNRIRLALLLAEGPASVRNQSRAQELLEGMDKEQTSQSGRALSALLQQVIAEHDWFIDELAAARSELEESESRIEELERQLQELTSIEQNIQQREIPQ
jgi:polyhydroxyalkanoate synthesis regulator phasin